MQGYFTLVEAELHTARCVSVCVCVCAVKEFCSTPATSPCMCGTQSHSSAKTRVRRREQSRRSDPHEPPASSGQKHLLKTTETGTKEYDSGRVLLNSSEVSLLTFTNWVYYPKAIHN